ncbi:DUF6053 domain-containing protein [Lysobacter yananisis]|uniref:DUF6053 domain-containing protein n=1 Tax=Lysobacter yananisis TaxID=1003114 RepID=UPI003CE53328
MGGPSGPMLLCQLAATRPKSVGAEAPPTKAAALPHSPGCCGRAFRPDALAPARRDPTGKHRG